MMIVSRRFYLGMKLQIQGVSVNQAQIAVSRLAAEHPEWNMEEEKTWTEWEGMTSESERKYGSTITGSTGGGSSRM